MKEIKHKLDKDYYSVKMIGKNITFQRILLVKNDPHWIWKGILHESITTSTTVQGGILEGVINQYNHVLGYRSSDPNKWSQDIRVLEEGLRKEPNNSRYVFYLAQTLAANGQLEKALTQYQRRIDMDEHSKDGSEELFWSLYCIGCLQSDLQKPHDLVIQSFLRAFYYNKKRAEPLYRLALQCQLMEAHVMGYVVLKWALKIPLPSQAMRIQHSVYDYLMRIKLAELAYSLQKFEESLATYQSLLDNPKVPEETKLLIQKNIDILSIVPT